jgi:hypothetical protein
MSERGTWVTEYIYCPGCVEQFKRFLVDTGCLTDGSKYWSYVQLSPWAFAGRISGLYAGEELHAWEHMVQEYGPMMCHPIRIAVLAENGSQIFQFGGEQLAR